MALTRKHNRRKRCRRKTCKRGGWINKLGVGFLGNNLFSRETGSYKGNIEQECFRILGFPRICRDKKKE
jgi:hypothetical protein